MYVHDIPLRSIKIFKTTKSEKNGTSNNLKKKKKHGTYEYYLEHIQDQRA